MWLPATTKARCARSKSCSSPSTLKRFQLAISGWTSARSPAAAQAELQARGIAAHEALDTPGLYDCPQLQHRQHFVEIAHDIYQTTTIESTRLKLSVDEARVPERALHFGRDNRYVLEEILGYPPERIAELAEQGVLM